MGNFIGHAAPGSFFLLFGLWWTIKYSVMWASRMGGGKTRSAHKACCCSGPLRFLSRVPVEGLFKIICTSAGAACEQIKVHWTLFDPMTGQVRIPQNWQHTTMYMFFALNGFSDILIALRAPVPVGLDYATMSLACAVEGLLFFYHLHGRGNLDVLVHQLLIVAIVPGVAVTALEARNPHTVYLPMLRAALALLNGTWLWQAGFILYPPFPDHDWDLEDQGSIKFVTMLFCWHILGILLFMYVVYVIVYHICQVKEKLTGTEVELGPLSPHTPQAQSESDME